MSIDELYNGTEHVQNMSRVHLGEQDLICMSNGSGSNSTCTIPAGLGISLSTPILMMTIGVVGNVLALLVLYSSRREAQARRTVFFVMLAGLAWSDLAAQLTVSPIAIVTYANNLQWVGGTPLCRYHGVMMVSFGLVIPLIVSCMSCERFIAIRFSYFYARHITRRKAQLTFLACWTVTATFTALPFVGFGSYERQYPGTWCFLNFHKESVLDSIYAAMFAVLNIVAICVMIICNVVVALTLLRLRMSKHLNGSPSLDRRLSVSGVVGSSTTPGTVIRGRRHSDMEAQMIWFLCLITIAFSVCWMPLNIHIFLRQFSDKNNPELDLIVIRMASCNQILDPWLYVIFRKNSMLRIFKRLKACFGKKKEPPRNGTQRCPSVRYVMGNRSFTMEATTMGKSVMHGKGDLSPSVPLKDPFLKAHSEISLESMESMSRLMCIASNHEDHSRRRRSDQKPLIDLRLGHSPTDKRTFETVQSESHCPVLTSNMSQSFNQCVSLPLIEKKKDNSWLNGRPLTGKSECGDVLRPTYDSVGSTNCVTYCQPSIQPGTPTNEREDPPDTSGIKMDRPQRQPPKSMMVTDSNYVVISPPPSTPERSKTPLLASSNTLYILQALTPSGKPQIGKHRNGQSLHVGDAMVDINNLFQSKTLLVSSKSNSENLCPSYCTPDLSEDKLTTQSYSEDTTQAKC
ncbi:prostaglandin E2 receptor EP4 subtype-like [Biomphalaria glabrata]|uniref:Thromboxane A2 receptor n=1 Tax=Biomphalaria glabrata TaxID=6526 RepID=A0A9U8E6H0_BIOGL|nr:prostaglandin E2 receptor EP4 subtype-like [Biomphalaria glabrata]XP_055884868.1 prostaglandin E2 receptor EP4 subtype-like [Biomphalaria glabrata]KAI8787322.1 prostaglandin E2 receptor EP4 subtype [Biomphalaria glabrata]